MATLQAPQTFWPRGRQKIRRPGHEVKRHGRAQHRAARGDRPERLLHRAEGVRVGSGEAHVGRHGGLRRGRVEISVKDTVQYCVR